MGKQHYGFAIIGAGVIGKSHAERLQSVAKGKLVAVCDKNEQSGRQLAGQFGCDWSGDIHEVLEREDVDIVNICLPSGMHAEYTVLAARAGKHVITEKPIDITAANALKMIEECRKAGVKLAVISQHRLQSSTQRVKKAMEDGKFGRLIIGAGAIHWYRSQEYYDSGAWRGTWAFDGGGALMNQGVHTVDVLQYLMGPVESVYAHCETLGHERIEVEDAAVVTLRFRSGAVGTLVATTCAYPGLTARIEIFGKSGSAIIEGDELVYTKFESDEEHQTNENGPAFKAANGNGSTAADPTAINGEGHILQMNDMIAAIEENREPIINGEEGFKPLEIILAVYESARTGRAVTIGDRSASAV
ncbi:Gfo/Idh/MocA family protein [Paenibacillus allorhizosphaerae]|uniref:Inositol 2-dehydrogenase/D-chiro-inositol 3-dehydrogenase n=1 Tax=Paenibacillus allorhizosphaerae TaxID=2849866 RepID=A0ABM8VGS9_9BACL|nr:Gfo/Idh/MocA family oxidoreductase [Paenibacillus allorhizosphaerae]CAG7639461.1 Inositol 2-dehydrogenase/D-chiro-inositol 3-dehydrogenase [Paenibacillus allorhizosphaerae]